MPPRSMSPASPAPHPLPQVLLLHSLSLCHGALTSAGHRQSLTPLSQGCVPQSLLPKWAAEKSSLGKWVRGDFFLQRKFSSALLHTAPGSAEVSTQPMGARAASKYEACLLSVLLKWPDPLQRSQEKDKNCPKAAGTSHRNTSLFGYRCRRGRVMAGYEARPGLTETAPAFACGPRTEGTSSS